MTQFLTSLKLFIVMTVLTGILYPIVILLFSVGTMPEKANGSLIYQGETLIGSSLLSQHFTLDKYFWPRPSAINYDPLKPSGGSNLGPTSSKLKDILTKRMEELGKDAPRDLPFASGSGLDPHISLEGAYFQIKRIANARKISEDQLKKIVDEHVEGRQWGLFGPPYVNVLKLNVYLEKS